MVWRGKLGDASKHNQTGTLKFHALTEANRLLKDRPQVLGKRAVRGAQVQEKGAAFLDSVTRSYPPGRALASGDPIVRQELVDCGANRSQRLSRESQEGADPEANGGHRGGRQVPRPLQPASRL
jgi:hypothetical protein